MKFIEILAQIKAVLNNFAGVGMSFGKPMQVNDITIIPVAKVSFGLGGGGGSTPVKDSPKKIDADSPEADDSSGMNEGGGGGGGITTSPVGIYTIKGDKVKFYPVVGLKEVGIFIGVFFMLFFRMMKLSAKLKKDKKRIG
ncbi:MAG: spore germination protein GerW family protein [Candidatus Cloacimonadaceae bacterium]|nr:spore germination protein GerW family protein [Candidatus Cloacimonadaceae bacterium]MDP3114000.1 spore germination protein GerW family protein [Candidatus Cloacimonadaceae bacterium]